MKLSLIVAVSDDNVIGQNNTLPWNLPADLRYFKQHTMGKPIIMGRKTFLSIGKALPGRLNIVLSGSPDLQVPAGVLLSNNINGTLEQLQLDNTAEAFIIGGAKVFETCLPLIDCLYITRVHGNFMDGDVFFPHIDHSYWKLVWEEPHLADEKNKYAYTFQHYEKVTM